MKKTIFKVMIKKDDEKEKEPKPPKADNNESLLDSPENDSGESGEEAGGENSNSSVSLNSDRAQAKPSDGEI